MKDNEILIIPRFAEIDMIKVVHHSRYWVWFEEAKFHFLESVFGITLNDVTCSNILLPVIDCKCSYISSVRWKDNIKITTKINIDNPSSLIFSHQIFSISEEREKLICRAYVKHAFVNQDFQLKLRIPTLFLDAIKKQKNRVDVFFSEKVLF